jgi:UDP-N-acetyl-D-mannosaminuronate dehydrogenase
VRSCTLKVTKFVKLFYIRWNSTQNCYRSGYVGLPLARLFATRHAVVGFDINQSRVAELKSGIDTTLEIDTTTLKRY